MAIWNRLPIVWKLAFVIGFGALLIFWELGAFFDIQPKPDVLEALGLGNGIGGVVSGRMVGVLATLVLVSSAVFIAIYAILVRPLTRARQAICALSEGAYDQPIAGTGRKDEFGAIAKALEGFREALRAAELHSAENLFRGAAMAASSAPQMILDRHLRITHVNNAFRSLYNVHGAGLAGADVTDLVGIDLEALCPTEQPIWQQLFSDPSEGALIDVQVPAGILRVEVKAVEGPEGQCIGYVAEWQDVSAERRNHALLASIENQHFVAEFDHGGQLLAANEKFRSLFEGKNAPIGVSVDAILRRRQGNADDAAASRDLLAPAALERALRGRFEVLEAQDEVILFATLSPLDAVSEDRRGFVLIGSDVTDTEHALQTVSAARDQMEADQQQVVDALRVALRALATGDLTVDITEAFADAHDQLRHDFNASVTTLAGAVLQISDSGATIRRETEDISNAAENLSRRTEKQAATLEETAAALDQLTANVKLAADGADQAAGGVRETRVKADVGAAVMQQAIDAMGEIETASQQIAKIITVIEDIAFQTNLLALNAGVEAARAGDAGRGFSVVASEVRALAQRTAEAAGEVSDLISTGERHVRRGAELVVQSGDELRGIVDAVSGISDQVDEIARSANEQSSGLVEINAAVTSLDQVTQQNAAMFQETTAASYALQQEVDGLQRILSAFQVREGAAEHLAVPMAGPGDGGDAGPISNAEAQALARGLHANQGAGSAAEDLWTEF